MHPRSTAARYRLRPRRIPNYRTLAAQHLSVIEMLSTPTVNHIYNKKGHREKQDSLLKGSNSRIWWTALGNEIGRLAQGINGRVVSTDTIEFINKCYVPLNKKVTYANFICDYRPLKSEPFRIRLTVGGDRLPYDNDAGSPAASLLETKLIANSVISDAHKGARFLSSDLKDFFLASPMAAPEYMRIHYRYFPDEIKKQYQLDKIVDHDGYIYIKIKKGMYGLKQAAILVYNKLVNTLEPHGYSPCPNTSGTWKHRTRKTKFSSHSRRLWCQIFQYTGC